MTTIARGISATSTILDVSDESLNVARPFLATLDSETVRVRGLEYVSGLATRWNVDRGIDSTPATHAGGATVTLGDVAGRGGAAEPGTVVAQATEPETPTAGMIWIDTSLGEGLDQWLQRNGANDGWIATIRARTVAAGDAIAFAGLTAEAPGDGGADAVVIGQTSGLGTATAIVTADAMGDGESNAALDARAAGTGRTWIDVGAVQLGTGEAEVSVGAFRGAGVASLTLRITNAGLVQHILLGLPTADPGELGALWNDTGTVKVSAG